MPSYGDFIDLRRHEADAGFRVRDGLSVTRDGVLALLFDPSGPLYVNQRGEIAIRVGDGLAVAAGSPKRLVVSSSVTNGIDSISSVRATQSAQAATIESHTTALAALSPLPAPGAAVAALAEATPTDLATALLAVTELQTTVAALRSRLIDFGVIDP